VEIDMAIKLEFCNVIVPVKKIREKLGEDVFESQFSLVTDTTWQDGHLFRDGCMNQHDLAVILDEWESKGFELLTVIDGKKHWKDVCVVNSGHGPSYPCAWIEFDPDENIVWLKGHEPGVAVGPPGRKVAGEA
jgi:hypothetical protein